MCQLLEELLAPVRGARVGRRGAARRRTDGDGRRGAQLGGATDISKVDLALAAKLVDKYLP